MVGFISSSSSKSEVIYVLKRVCEGEEHEQAKRIPIGARLTELLLTINYNMKLSSNQIAKEHYVFLRKSPRNQGGDTESPQQGYRTDASNRKTHLFRRLQCGMGVSPLVASL